MSTCCIRAGSLPVLALAGTLGCLAGYIQAEGVPNPVKHSLQTDDPGRVHLDLWGWETSPFYQRTNPKVVLPDYLMKRAVDESYKWGANLLELHRGGYPFEKRVGWTQQSTAALHKHIHARGMTLQWLPHKLNSSSVDNSIRGLIDLFADHFDCLSVSSDVLLDGMGTEQWSTMSPSLFMKCVLPYSPSIWVYTDNKRFSTTLPNECDLTASNGVGSDDQTEGYYKLQPQIDKVGGLQYEMGMTECRTGMPGNKYGGFGYPDWILKQVNDLFRCRALARGAKNLSPSAMVWINEAEAVCPDEVRPYVYGISQDPIKAAVTSQFTALGAGRTGSVAAGAPGGERLPQRYDYPAKAAFIQNNYLNLVLMPEKDEILLQNDPERLAHWDKDSCALDLSSRFLRTVVVRGNAAPSCDAVEFTHVEPAGYKAVLRVRYRLNMDGTAVDEVQTFEMNNDSPYVCVSVERNADKSSVALGAEISTHAYDRLIADGTTHTSAVHLPVAQTLRLIDTTGKLPELVLVVLDKGQLNGISWQPKTSLILGSGPSLKESFKVAVVVPDGLYKVEDYPALAKFLSSAEEEITLNASGEATVENPFPIPLVKVLRIRESGPDPYQVFEFGQWVFRGAQVSQTDKSIDYLKVYLPANGTAKIRRCGYINDVVRTGWGCQYTVAMRDVQRTGTRCSLTAEVRDITSFLFAPRVLFKNPIARVKVNAEPWRYLEGDCVFLPNRRGTYRIEVVEGADDDPCLARTFADVASSSYSNGTLKFTARLPEWTESIPDDYHFYAWIRHPAKSVSKLSGAELVRTVDGKASVIRFKPGMIGVDFDAPGSNNELAAIDQSLDIARHLRKEQAERTLPYLKPFDASLVTLETLTSNKAALDSYDVIVWNHYFQDKLPAVADAHVSEILHAAMQNGKGLMLIANAMEAAPEIIDGSPRRPLTPIQLHHNVCYYFDTEIDSVGLEAVAGKIGHPVFAGLATSEKPTFTMISLGWLDLFKRALWEKEPEVCMQGTPLAEIYSEPRPNNPKLGVYLRHQHGPNLAFTPGIVLREWQVGQGKLLGYYCQLRYAYGSREFTVPSDKERTFVHNAVKYLAAGTHRIRVAVLE